MSYMIVSLPPYEAWEQRLIIGDIYHQAFECSAEAALGFVENSFCNVLTYEGATVLAAIAREAIVGFLYGYTFRRGNWWPEKVGPLIIATDHEHVMASAFELVELAVLPSHQGQGIGSELMRYQFERQPQTHVLLSTNADPGNRAISLYWHHGFEVLVPDFQYSPNGGYALIMGANVKLNSESD